MAKSARKLARTASDVAASRAARIVLGCKAITNWSGST
jgi:hypothetical protein